MDAIIAKLDRAHEHLEILDSAILEFHKSRPYTFSSEFQRKGESVYDWVFTIHIHKEIPLRISAIFGDGIQNVRSTLDYLAYRLAVSHVGINGNLDGTEFPIFINEDRFMAIDSNGHKQTRGRVWTSSGLYKIRNIAPKAQAVIESLQPYRGGNNVMLGHLHEFSIIDKHRYFHIVSPPFGDWFAGTPLGNGLSSKPIKGLIIRSGVIKKSFIDGTEVARFEVVTDPSFDFKVRVKHTIPSEVILDESVLPNSYASKILAGLIGFVRKEVIPQLSPFLK